MRTVHKFNRTLGRLSSGSKRSKTICATSPCNSALRKIYLMNKKDKERMYEAKTGSIYRTQQSVPYTDRCICNTLVRWSLSHEKSLSQSPGLFDCSCWCCQLYNGTTSE